jgi:hypothetical protein
MLLDLAKPVALLLCIFSLYAVFHAAFLTPGIDYSQKISIALLRLAVAASISLVSGLIFRDSHPSSGPTPSCFDTLPVQLFGCALAGMVLLFVVSWYLETHVIFYRDINP